MPISKTHWYVGAMNDACFIIDQPPQPAPVDYVCNADHYVTVIAGPLKQEIAEQITATHNAAFDSHKAKVERLEAVLRGIRDAAQPIIRDPESINTFAKWAAQEADAALIESPETKESES